MAGVWCMDRYGMVLCMYISWNGTGQDGSDMDLGSGLGMDLSDRSMGMSIFWLGMNTRRNWMDKKMEGIVQN